MHEGPLRLLTFDEDAPQLPLLRGRQSRGSPQLAAGGVATFDLLGQPDLVVLGQQRILPDVRQVQAYEIFLVPFNSFFCHGVPFSGFAERARICGFTAQHQPPPCL
ncbi:MAG: hypothetical protein ACRDY7_04505 [Acidimicrobiia bacterium]